MPGTTAAVHHKTGTTTMRCILSSQGGLRASLPDRPGPSLLSSRARRRPCAFALSDGRLCCGATVQSLTRARARSSASCLFALPLTVSPSHPLPTLSLSIPTNRPARGGVSSRSCPCRLSGAPAALPFLPCEARRGPGRCALCGAVDHPLNLVAVQSAGVSRPAGVHARRPVSS